MNEELKNAINDAACVAIEALAVLIFVVGMTLAIWVSHG